MSAEELGTLGLSMEPGGLVSSGDLFGFFCCSVRFFGVPIRFAFIPARIGSREWFSVDVE